MIVPHFSRNVKCFVGEKKEKLCRFKRKMIDLQITIRHIPDFIRPLLTYPPKCVKMILLSFLPKKCDPIHSI